MTPQEATDIARLRFQPFVQALESHATDRDTLLRIKDAVENGRRDASGENRRWMNVKLQEVDTYLRRVKQQKSPGLKSTGGAAAFVYSLVKDGEYWNEASLRRPEEYLAHLCRTIMDTDEIPVIAAFIPQTDIDSIPEAWWDDTNPNAQQAQSEEPYAPLHEAFSR